MLLKPPRFLWGLSIERRLTVPGGFEEIESRILRFALDRSRGNISATARLLKLRRGQVEYRLKRYEHPL